MEKAPIDNSYTPAPKPKGKWVTWDHYDTTMFRLVMTGWLVTKVIESDVGIWIEYEWPGAVS